jgi:hypothetical protein
MGTSNVKASDRLSPVGDHRRPVLAIDEADHQEPWFAGGAGRDLQEGGISPESLGGEEVDAEFGQVDGTLRRIELKLPSAENLYLFSTAERLRSEAGRSCATQAPALFLIPGPPGQR